jgi:hypothetical protein
MRDLKGAEMEDSERAYSCSQVKMWPPDSALDDLHSILYPKKRAGEVTAQLGDEGIIYMAGPPQGVDGQEQKLIFISFDPTFGFNGMKRLDGTLALPKIDRKRKSATFPQEQGVDTDTASGGNLSESAKRPRLESEVEPAGAHRLYASMAIMDDYKPEPDMSVLAPGDATAQALSLDPPLAPLTKSEPPIPTTVPELPPHSSQSAPRLTQFEPSICNSNRTEEEPQGKGKARANPPPASLPTRRERATYLSLNDGFWTR